MFSREMCCDGICETEYSYTDDWYACIDCADVLFNSYCLEKLRAGTLGRLICNKDHEMVHYPKYNPKKLKAIGKGNVEVGGKVMSVEDWKAGIRTSYGLEPLPAKVQENGMIGNGIKEIEESTG